MLMETIMECYTDCTKTGEKVISSRSFDKIASDYENVHGMNLGKFLLLSHFEL